MAIIYTVEGNIGSGKSTLVKILKKLLPQRISATKFIFLQEPVDIWNTIKDSDGKTIIENTLAVLATLTDVESLTKVWS